MTLNEVKEKIEGITNDFEFGVSDKKETNKAILALLVDFSVAALERSSNGGDHEKS